MGMDTPLFIAGLVLGCVLTRLPFLFRHSSDKATHLWLIQSFQRDRRIRKRHYRDSIQQGMIFYPPLPHYFLSFLPRPLWVLAGVALNIASDLGVCLGIFVILRGDLRSDELAFLGALLWLTLPILHPINARLIGLGSRCTGPALFFLYVAGLQIAAVGMPASGIALGVAAGVAMILSSQFGTQVIVFTSLIATAMTGSWIPLAAVLGSFGVGLLVRPLGVAEQLRGKFHHFSWYWREGRRYIGIRNSPRHLYRLSRTAGGPVKVVAYLLESVTLVVIAVGFAGVLLIFTWAWWEGWPWPWQPPNFTSPLGVASTVSLASVIPCLLTMWGPLIILGEAERYVEYASPWIVLTMLMSLPANEAGIVAALLYGILANIAGVLLNLAGYSRRQFQQSFSLEPADDMAQLHDALDNLGSRRIATSPLTLVSEIALHDRGKHRYLSLLITDPKRGLAHWPSGEAVYPYIAMDSANLVSRWSVDTVVVDKDSLRVMTGVMDPKNLVDAKIVFENARFLVYAL